MINKELINIRFSKTLSTYDDNAIIQKKMAEKLSSFLDRKDYIKVLEIGCGTGLLTKKIVNNVAFKIYKAIDIVSDSEFYIKKINSQIEFVNDDIENFLDINKDTYDLIVSNASLQWVDDFKSTILKLVSKLNKDGQLLLTTFGKENFREIYHVIGATLNYYSIKELEQMFMELNPIIEEEIHIMSFDTPREVLKHLQLTGVNAIEKTSWTKKNLIQFENGYQNLCSRRTVLTYNPIYIKINK